MAEVFGIEGEGDRCNWRRRKRGRRIKGARNFRRSPPIPRFLRRGTGEVLGMGRGFAAPLQKRGVAIAPRGLGLLATASNRRAGLRGIDCHVDGLFPLTLTPMRPLPRLCGLAGFEEVGARCRLVEDLQYEREHHLLDLGDREGLGRRDGLEGTTHQMGVPLGHELDPGNKRHGRLALGQHHKRNEPALIQVPAGAKGLETKFLRRGRGTLRLRSLRGGSGGNVSRHVTLCPEVVVTGKEKMMSHISQVSMENRKKMSHTSMMLTICSSRLATFALTDAAIHDVLGMLPSCTLGLRYVINSHMAGCSTKRML